jgi:hypothetical protein
VAEGFADLSESLRVPQTAESEDVLEGSQGAIDAVVGARRVEAAFKYPCGQQIFCKTSDSYVTSLGSVLGA